MNVKKRKKRQSLHDQFEQLSRPQLVALARQRTDFAYFTLLNLSKKALIDTMVIVPGVLKPVQA